MLFKIPGALRLAPPRVFGTTLDDLMAGFPSGTIQMYGNERTKWKVEPGADGTGRLAYAVLSLNKETSEILVFGAIENDRAPEHLHKDGEVIYTLGGVGNDVTDDGVAVELHPGSIIVHKKDTIHSPGSKGLWVFVYYQPAGMQPHQPVPG